MNRIIYKGTQIFNGKNIKVLEGGFGEGCRILTDKQISEIHNMENKNIRARIKDNILRFKEGIDFIDLKGACDVSTLESFGYSKQAITQCENIFVLSERGYSKLIKIMDTDLAWEIMDKLIEEYFAMRKMVNKPKSEEDMLLELFPDTDSNLVLLTANTIRENKRLVLENKNLVTEVIRKEDIIIGYVDKTTLAEKRQILNRVVKHKTSDYKARYGELYKQFEMKYHINLNHRFNKYNEEHTPKCKSKMAYICEIMNNTNELYEIAVKLYESDVKELVAQMYGLQDTTVI